MVSWPSHSRSKGFVVTFITLFWFAGCQAILNLPSQLSILPAVTPKFPSHKITFAFAVSLLFLIPQVTVYVPAKMLVRAAFQIIGADHGEVLAVNQLVPAILQVRYGTIFPAREGGMSSPSDLSLILISTAAGSLPAVVASTSQIGKSALTLRSQIW